jgi:DNA-binding NtrC family response regulator
MNAKKKDTIPLLLIVNSEVRQHIFELLKESHYDPLVVAAPTEVLQHLKGKKYPVVFMDCEAVAAFGLGIFSKFKVASQSCRLILICDKVHKDHREIVRGAIEIGIYACLLAPYEDWEVLTLVRFYSRV